MKKVLMLIKELTEKHLYPIISNLFTTAFNCLQVNNKYLNDYYLIDIQKNSLAIYILINNACLRVAQT